MKYWTRSKSN